MTNEYENLDYINILNPEQKDIATSKQFLSEDERLCIIACAGSGKTRTIISKIIYMIKILNCDPAEFFVTTFTRNAANELRERLHEYLTDEEIDKITIGTFHSIAYTKIMINSTNIIEDNIESYLHRYHESLTLKDNGYQHINIEKQDEDDDEDGDDDEYMNKDEDINMDNIVNDSDDETVDSMFGDMDFEEDEICDNYITKHEYKYVFIDEYQDINCIQEEIICRLE